MSTKKDGEKEAENSVVTLESPEVKGGSPFVMAAAPDDTPELLEPDSDVDLFSDEQDLEEMVDEIHANAVKEDLQEQLELQRVQSALRNKKGLTATLYHINRTGEKVYYYKVEDVGKHMGDLENYIQGLIDENDDWPGGKWFVQVKNNRGVRKLQTNLTFKEKPKPLAPSSHDNVLASTAIQQNSELMDKMLALAHEKGDDSLVTELLKENLKPKDPTEEMTRMATLMQMMNPPKQESETTKALILAMAPVIGEVAKKLFAPRKEQSMVEIIQMVQSLNADKPQDSFGQALDMFTRVSELVRSNAPASDSPVAEIIKQVMPHIGGTLANVSESISDAIKLKREHLAAQVAHGGGRRMVEHQPKNAQTINEEGVAEMHPTAKKIYDAVKSNDEGFYPELESIISTLIDPNMVPSLVNGTVTVEAFVQQVSVVTPQFNNPETQQEMIAYMNGFVDSKLGEAIAERDANVVQAKCPKCNEVIEYDSKKDYEDDKICGQGKPGACEGVLELIVDAEDTKEPEEVNPEEVVSEETPDNISGDDNQAMEVVSGDNGGSPAEAIHEQGDGI